MSPKHSEYPRRTIPSSAHSEDTHQLAPGLQGNVAVEHLGLK